MNSIPPLFSQYELAHLEKMNREWRGPSDKERPRLRLKNIKVTGISLVPKDQADPGTEVVMFKSRK